MSGSSAVCIHLIGAIAWGPIEGRGRATGDDDMIHLGQMALSVKISHGYTTDWDLNARRGGDHAFDRESVIAVQDPIRTESAGGLRPTGGYGNQHAAQDHHGTRNPGDFRASL